MTTLQLSDKGIRFLEHAEGFRAKAYPDAGYWSIGYGTLLDTPEELALYRHATITRETGRRLMMEHVRKVEAAINKAVTVALVQWQFDGLGLLTYNIGIGRNHANPEKRKGFLGSTLLRLLNRGDYTGVSAQFAVWRKSEGEISPPLVARRKLERAIFDGQTVEHYA